MIRTRNHTAYWAFLVHRISGIALALFLPAHFWFLGTALSGAPAMDAFLRWTEQPLVVAGEWLIVMMLAAHLAGGLRLLVLEFLPWRNWQKTLAALAAAFTLITAFAFAIAR